MADLVPAPLASFSLAPRFPAGALRFEQKRLKVTVVATFEIASNEVRDEIEKNVADALSVLGLRGQLKTGYEVIR
jgi:hypothetical protein